MTTPLLKRLPRNSKGRTLAVGDIHGHFSRLRTHLDHIQFDPDQGDILISVGDLVDRGPENDAALEWLAEPWFHAIRGNHEWMAIEWAKGTIPSQYYVQNGGGWNVANPQAVRDEIRHAFEALPIAIEVETAAGRLGIVHADCPLPKWDLFTTALLEPNFPPQLREQAIQMAQWSRERIDNGDMGRVEGVEAVIVGHTPVDRYTSLGNTLYIDTGGWTRRANFTVLDLDTLKPLYAGSQALAFD